METRRILLDDLPTTVVREGNLLISTDSRKVRAEDAYHLPPCKPTKIVCIHLNYESRVKEFLATLPPAPTYFHKPISALNRHGGDVVRPPGCRYLNYEGEIAIVIGSECRHIAPAEAPAYIAGYTIANDFGLHDFRDTDAGSMLRVKGSDTLCPLGPGIVDDWAFGGKRIRTLVNGEVRQDGSTDEMVWDMYSLVADLARTITVPLPNRCSSTRSRSTRTSVGRADVPPPTETGVRNSRISSTRPCRIACAARVAPPTLRSFFAESFIARTSSRSKRRSIRLRALEGSPSVEEYTTLSADRQISP